MMLDPHGMDLLRRHDAAFHRWQNGIGDQNTRWTEMRQTVNALYDHLCLLDDMWDIAEPLCEGFPIETFRRWRRQVNWRIEQVAIKAQSKRWIPLGRNHGHVEADVHGCLQNSLRPLLYKTVTKHDCLEF
jgi:hypothetical protein